MTKKMVCSLLTKDSVKKRIIVRSFSPGIRYLILGVAYKGWFLFSFDKFLEICVQVSSPFIWPKIWIMILYGGTCLKDALLEEAFQCNYELKVFLKEE